MQQGVGCLEVHIAFRLDKWEGGARGECGMPGPTLLNSTAAVASMRARCSLERAAVLMDSSYCGAIVVPPLLSSPAATAMRHTKANPEAHAASRQV